MFAAVLAIAPAQADDALSPNQIGAIEGLIRNYILAHPEVIVESVQAMRERDESASHQRAKQNLVALRDQLINDSNSPIAGNPDGDVTIVEFFDYRCSYCKASLAVVRQILEEDPGVRLVFKEFPILSPESANAARAALAAQNQGKYFPFHNALMAARGSFSESQIMEIAAEVGLNINVLERDMRSQKIQAIIDANTDLAADLNINGTPTFIIGDQVKPGALDIGVLREMIAAKRAG
tara:strand:+ start:36 stop:746 length:711 start_codon:yes stop_codon:yes gene_type:complete